MKLLLNIILVLLTFSACYVEDVYLYFWPPQTGKAVFLTLRSDQSFNFDQEKALGGKRNIALSQYVPFYTYSPEKQDSVKKKTETFIKKISAFKTQKQVGEAAFWRYLKKEFRVDFRRDEVEKLYRYSNLENLLELIMNIEESILQNKIVEDIEPLEGKKKIEIFYPDSASTSVFSVNKLLTVEEARLNFQKKVPKLLWQVDKGLLDSVLKIFLPTISTNLKYDQKENDRRIEKIIGRYPSRVISCEPGDVLVPFRKVLSEEDVLLLDAYQKIEKKVLYERVAWVLFVIVLMVILYNLLLSRIFLVDRQAIHQRLLMLLIMTVILLKACLLFTPFPVHVLPFAFLPLVMILLDHERISAVGTMLMGSILVSLFSGQTFGIFIFFTLGGLGAILSSLNIRKRVHILIPSFVVGLINTAGVMAFSINWGKVAFLSSDLQKIGISPLGEIFNAAFLTHAGWAFMGGVIAGPVALLLLPLLELIWHTAPSFRFSRYSDLQNPVMREFLNKAPGTYQHTMAVAYLAQAVGEDIGANALLLRVGAYYHDIGKMVNPQLYIENQFDGNNGHDSMDPQKSARFIINHVREGKKIGQKMGLPEGIVDLILQHHGTQLVEYFYDKAARANPGSVRRKENYRYPGPKPQSVEAAILMIVDAAEATSRSFENPTREKLENMVRFIIEKRIADGQFDECDISTRDLGKIVQSLTGALEASFHSRVEYPWQEEKK